MDRSAVRAQVDRIVYSRTFAGKSQLCKLLVVLFDQMDSQDRLKPNRVIRELWPDEVRTKRSADVATEINRLRKALESYYSSEGAADPLVIKLPNRSVASTEGIKERRWITAEPRGDGQKAASAPVASTRPAVVRRRKVVIIAVVVGIAILAAALVVFRMLAPERPQAARLDGSTLIVTNAKGEELWRKGFPEGLWPEYYGQGPAPRMWFGDLDGKGRTDVLFLYHPAVDPNSRSTTLICYSDRGKEKWRWTPGKELPELAGNPPSYRTVGLGVLKATANRPPRIVVSSFHVPQYPSQVALVDSQGKTVSEYWHSGHFDFLTLADIDGNGREMIVVPGISNGYRQATLVVLDPDKVFGASIEAARPEIQLHGMGAPQERVRLLFPRSDLNKALSMYNQSLEAAVDHGKTRLAVMECRQVQDCDIWYEFDKDFQLLSVEASDPFRNAHAEFYLKNNPNHHFGAEEEREFQKVRCLVGCDAEYVAVQSH